MSEVEVGQCRIDLRGCPWFSRMIPSCLSGSFPCRLVNTRSAFGMQESVKKKEKIYSDCAIVIALWLCVSLTV